MPNQSFALGALGALGYLFFEPDAVSAQQSTKPPRSARQRIGGYGGKERARNADAQHLSPAKKGGRFTAKTRCLFFKLAQL